MQPGMEASQCGQLLRLVLPLLDPQQHQHLQMIMPEQHACQHSLGACLIERFAGPCHAESRTQHVVFPAFPIHWRPSAPFLARMLWAVAAAAIGPTVGPSSNMFAINASCCKMADDTTLAVYATAKRISWPGLHAMPLVILTILKEHYRWVMELYTEDAISKHIACTVAPVAVGQRIREACTVGRAISSCSTVNLATATACCTLSRLFSLLIMCVPIRFRIVIPLLHCSIRACTFNDLASRCLRASSTSSAKVSSSLAAWKERLKWSGSSVRLLPATRKQCEKMDCVRGMWKADVTTAHLLMAASSQGRLARGLLSGRYDSKSL